MLKGSALRTLESLVAIAAGFITLPLMMFHLGEDLYGFWVLVGSFTGLMYIFDLGFASAVTRQVTHAIAQEDDTAANKVVNSALLIYSFLGLLILLVSIGIALFYQPDLTGVVSHSDFQTIIILMGGAVALEFPVKAFAGIAYAHYRFDLMAGYRITLKILSSTALIILLLTGFEVLAIAVMSFISSIIAGFTFLLMAWLIYRKLKISSRFISKATMKELFSYSSWAFLIDLNNIAKQRIDLFFIGGFISLSAVSIYYVPARLVEYANQLLFKMLGITLPILTDHEANRNSDRFRQDLVLFNRINSYCAVAAIAAVILFGKSILYYWMGSDFDFNTAYHILLVLMLGRLSALASDGFTTGLYATGQHRLTALISFLETLFSASLLGISLGIYKLGPIYAAYSIAAPIIIGRLIVLPLASSRILRLDRPLHGIAMSFRPLLLIIAALAIHLTLGDSNPELNLSLVTSSLTLACVVGLFMFMELSQREKALIHRLALPALAFLTPNRGK